MILFPAKHGCCCNKHPSTAAGAAAESPFSWKAYPQLLQVLLLDELTTFLDDEDQGGVLRAVRDVTSGDRRVTALWVSATAVDVWMPRLHSSFSMV